ncbi:MAG: prolipoprotein diacylglyceryl transferase [Polyangiaceae bacterium]
MHPQAFTIGPAASAWSVRVEPFGLFLALGLALGLLCARRSALQAKLSLEKGGAVSFAALFGALLGGRSVYALGSAEPTSWRSLLAFEQGGLSGYGALYGAALGAFLVLRSEARRARWFDLGAVAALLTIGVARLGCYLTGCDFGRPFVSPVPGWLARLASFPVPRGADLSPAWDEHWARGSVNAGSLATVPLHPTALYESLGALSLCALLLGLAARQRRAGAVAMAATLGYALLRFAVETVRDDAERGLLHGYSLNRIAAVLSVLLLIGLYVARRMRVSAAA